MNSGSPIDETGMLLRDGGTFVLRRDAGGVWRLAMHRVPVDLVGKHVRVIGVMGDEGVVDADGVQPG